MSIKKPIKNYDGKLKEWESSDELPNQPDIDYLTYIVRQMAFELQAIGIKWQNEEILKLISQIQ